jgi:hypothetical protein
MLQTPWNQRKNKYDFVVVGSGYGGAITAARLASAKLNPKPSVCILERGKEWVPGTFPENAFDAAAQLRSGANPLGLYELLDHPEIGVIKGSGLGGTSLINANVAIEPDKEVFEQLHESPRVMTIPLLILAVGSLAIGWIGMPEAIGGGNSLGKFLEPLFRLSTLEADGVSPRMEPLLMLMAFLVAGLGVGFAWYVYGLKHILSQKILKLIPGGKKTRRSF